MDLSIIVPVYNVAPWIEGCIRSILSQTRQDFELILVDDCGTDNSMQIAENTIKAYDGAEVVIIHHEHNKGLSAARNTGIKAANGKYLLFVDSDDRLLPTAVELLLGKAEQTNAEMVVGAIQMGGTASGLWSVNYSSEECIGKENIISNYLKQKWYSMAWNKLILADFLRNNRLFFNEQLKIHEDGFWNFQCYCHTEHVAFVHEPTYVYQVRENSIQTDKNLQKHLDACINVQGLIDKEAKNYKIDRMPVYKHWQDKIKAWIYRSFVEPQHNVAANEQFYIFVRSVAPNPRLTISHCHYFVWPYAFGMWMYKMTVGHLWKYD